MFVLHCTLSVFVQFSKNFLLIWNPCLISPMPPLLVFHPVMSFPEFDFIKVMRSKLWKICHSSHFVFFCFNFIFWSQRTSYLSGTITFCCLKYSFKNFEGLFNANFFSISHDTRFYVLDLLRWNTLRIRISAEKTFSIATYCFIALLNTLFVCYKRFFLNFYKKYRMFKVCILLCETKVTKNLLV